MSILEFFRTDHRHEQIGEEEQRDDGDNDRFHSNLLELLAKADVESACEKERDDNSSED
jgi:hypothetical protein